MEQYSPQVIEAQTQASWEETGAYEITSDQQPDNKKSYYACSMLPYPSGNLHMGHVRNYTINDVIARWKRMTGHRVLMPMGWDAFGLPAENAALSKNKSPATWTDQNIKSMKVQLKALGFAIDWTREINTSKPNYYRWNQWIFLKMLEKGIAYKKNGLVNWDPVDKTVLANEQVIDGKGWRSGAQVERREIPMYYLAITKYTDELLEGLNDLNWPPQVISMQRNWIGKSTGLRLFFRVNSIKSDYKDASGSKIFVFTTRPDTIMGVTFLALSVEHPVSKNLGVHNVKIKNFIKKHTSSTSEVDLLEQEKAGVFSGHFATHPISGEQIPLWIANYVLMSYGDGAVMGVPAHDERDHSFATKYNIPIKQVITPNDQTECKDFDPAVWNNCYSIKENSKCINSGKYNGLLVEDASEEIIRDVVKAGYGEKKTQTRLRDWGISRQRYWGTPIPIINCEFCGDVPVEEKELPVVLPRDLNPNGLGNPLNNYEEFYKTKCPRCDSPAKRETDTMDTFVDSSWYFMRYCCPHDNNAIVNEELNEWMPMDQYIGGIEHAILHLLYARFWTKVMRDLNLVKINEPFKKLLTQGMVLNQTYFRKSSDNSPQEYFNPDDVLVEKDSKGRITAAQCIKDNLPVELGKIEKMSKSKNNGVDPSSLISKYGADTCRLFTIFAAPPENTLDWSEDGVEGSFKFLKRLWVFHKMCSGYLKLNKNETLTIKTQDVSKLKLRTTTHEILSQANYDMNRYQFNTVASAAMKILNELEKYKKNSAVKTNLDTQKDFVFIESFTILLRILYPITPHICFYIWKSLGYEGNMGSILDVDWPTADEGALFQETIEITFQVNGKSRARVVVPFSSSKDDCLKAVEKTDAYMRFCKDKKVLRVIVVPNRLINLVVENR